MLYKRQADASYQQWSRGDVDNFEEKVFFRAQVTPPKRQPILWKDSAENGGCWTRPAVLKLQSLDR